uniref:Transcription repressor n=1 Tax=Leersia perrieri TaxID=77586 RepID=A0A0D9VTS4_9ORYZ
MPAYYSTTTSRWSWFHKLRRKRKKKTKRPSTSSAASTPARASDAVSVTPSRQPPAAATTGSPCSLHFPNRASYYLTTADRERQDEDSRQDRLLRCSEEDDGPAHDVRIDVVHRRADGLDAPPATPELKLRPIVTTRHVVVATKNETATSTDSSSATTPSTRAARGFHVGQIVTSRRLRRGHHDGNASGRMEINPSGRRRRRMWLRESEAVVIESEEPERELVDSMIEMLCTNGVRRLEDLQDLLACYLALNAAEHHRTIVALFRRVVLVWIHLGSQRLLPGQQQQPNPAQ